MGFFGSLLNIPTKAVRGLGRVLRGDFKKGLGDIGSAAKGAAPLLALTGVGTPLALGIGAGGGALEGATTGGGGVGDILGGAAGGAASTGAALAARGIGSRLLGGGADAAAKGVGEAAVREGVGDVATEALLDPTTSVAAQTAREGLDSAGKGLGSKLLGFAKEHPGVALQVPAMASSAYGAHQQGKALDKQLALEEEGLRRRWRREDNADPALAEILRRLLAMSPN